MPRPVPWILARHSIFELRGRLQLRAYDFPDQANLVWQGTSKPTVAEIVIKNSGQTPAYKLSTATSVDDNPLQKDLRVPSMPDNHTVIPPSGSYALPVAIDKPLTPDQLKAIQKGTHAIYALAKSPMTVHSANVG